MELTQHGSERIQGRTRMVAKDVLSLISHGAVVELGGENNFEYLLFYSPFDECAKIAVVTKDRTHLVSIWEKYFYLPPGILKVNRKRERAAKEALKAFLLRRSLSNSDRVAS